MTITFVIDAVNSASGIIKQVGADFTNLGNNIKSYQAQLEAATPQNQAFADRLQDIQRQVGEGFMSMDEGRAAVAQLGAEFDAANPKVKTMGEVVSGTIESIGKFTAAAGIAAIAVGKIWEFGKEGAQIELNQQRFDRLAVSIGTTADALKNELSQATRGMVTDAQQVELAGQIMSLGLADTEDSVVRLARLITENGWDMQTVILTFANNSKMRLDSLGLSVEDVDKRTQALVETGMSMDKAFDLAVIEAGEEKLKLLGSAADSSLGDMKRAETQIQNFVDTVKTGLVPVLGNAAEGFVNLVTAGDTAVETLAAHNEETLRTADGYDAYVEEMNRAIDSAGLLIGVHGQAVERQKIVTEAVYDAIRATENYGQTEAELGARIGAYIPMMGEANTVTESHVTTVWEMAQAYYVWINSETEAAQATQEFKQKSEALMATQKELLQTLRDAKPPIDEIIGAMKQDVSSPLSAFINDMQFFIASGGQDFVGAFNEIKTALATGAITPEEAVQFSGELLSSIENVKVAAGEIDMKQAAQNIADQLNIPLADAVKLLQDAGTAADVLDNLGVQIDLNSNLEQLQTDIAAANDGLTTMGEDALAALEPVEVSLDGIKNKVELITGTHDVSFRVTVTGDQIPNGGYNAAQGGGGNYTPTANAAGDPLVLPGEARLIGEQGPELFIPRAPGAIIPSNQTDRILAGSGGGGLSVTIGNITIQSNASNPEEIYKLILSRLGSDLQQAINSGY